MFLNLHILSPDFIPHNRFHLASWYKEMNGCEWYWSGGPRSEWGFPFNQDFYNTLDPELKTVVKKLHESGIVTTPSCAGHIVEDGYYGNKWEELKEQEERVNGKGIILIDPETSRFTTYKNPKYRVLWSKDQFIEAGQKHGKIGCLGIIPGIRRHHIPNNIDGFEKREDGKFLIFTTQSDSKKEIEEKWNHFSNRILRSLP